MDTTPNGNFTLCGFSKFYLRAAMAKSFWLFSDKALLCPGLLFDLVVRADSPAFLPSSLLLTE